MIIAGTWHACTAGICDENRFTSTLESQKRSRNSSSYMLPVVASRKEREKNHENYVENIGFRNGIKFCARDSNAPLIFSNNVGSREARRLAFGGGSAFFATGMLTVVCNFQLFLFFGV